MIPPYMGDTGFFMGRGMAGILGLQNQWGVPLK